MTTPNQRPIPGWIEKCSDRSQLKTLIDRCSDKPDHVDVKTAALRRYIGLAGLNFSDPLDQDFQRFLDAYELQLAAKHGRRQPAGYTRRMLNEGKTVVAILTDWALVPLDETTAGFATLIEAGLAEFLGEAIVLRHASRFEPHVVEAARRRLAHYGVDPAKVGQR